MARELVRFAKKSLPPAWVATLRHLKHGGTPPPNWHELEEQILHLLVPRDRIAIDVGANVGVYTTLLSSLAQKVIAFEPHSSNAEIIAARGLHNLDIRTCAVSNKVGHATLTTPADAHTEDRGRATLEADTLTETTLSKITVGTVALDTLAGQDVGFIKIDVEGHEVSVIEGAEKLIARQKPVILVEIEDSFRPNAVRDTARMIEALGYSGFFIFENRCRDIADFDPSMQNPAELKRTIRRFEMRYANNFIFVPKTLSAHALRERIDVFLGSSPAKTFEFDSQIGRPIGSQQTQS